MKMNIKEHFGMKLNKNENFNSAYNHHLNPIISQTPPFPSNQEEKIINTKKLKIQIYK